jgi:hypothetical protein
MNFFNINLVANRHENLNAQSFIFGVMRDGVGCYKPSLSRKIFGYELAFSEARFHSNLVQTNWDDVSFRGKFEQCEEAYWSTGRCDAQLDALIDFFKRISAVPEKSVSDTCWFWVNLAMRPQQCWEMSDRASTIIRMILRRCPSFGRSVVSFTEFLHFIWRRAESTRDAYNVRLFGIVRHLLACEALNQYTINGAKWIHEYIRHVISGLDKASPIVDDGAIGLISYFCCEDFHNPLLLQDIWAEVGRRLHGFVTCDKSLAHIIAMSVRFQGFQMEWMLELGIFEKAHAYFYQGFLFCGWVFFYTHLLKTNQQICEFLPVSYLKVIQHLLSSESNAKSDFSFYACGLLLLYHLLIRCDAIDLCQEIRDFVNCLIESHEASCSDVKLGIITCLALLAAKCRELLIEIFSGQFSSVLDMFHDFVIYCGETWEVIGPFMVLLNSAAAIFRLEELKESKLCVSVCKRIWSGELNEDDEMREFFEREAVQFMSNFGEGFVCGDGVDNILEKY